MIDQESGNRFDVACIVARIMKFYRDFDNYKFQIDVTTRDVFIPRTDQSNAFYSIKDPFNPHYNPAWKSHRDIQKWFGVGY